MQSLAVGLVIENKAVADETLTCLRELSVRILFQDSQAGDWTNLSGRLERLRPDAVLMDLAALGENWEETIRSVRRLPGSPPVMILHTSTDPQMILRAMRAGACEYLSTPVSSNLKEALERIAAERTEGSTGTRPHARIIGFLSAKGGCGATTIACHTAVEIQRQTKKRVLLADFDLETGIIGFLMKSKSPYSVLDALANIDRLDLSYWKAVISNGIPGLEVVKAPPVAPSRRPIDPQRLRHLLRFTSSHYDWVVVDLGRGLAPSSLAALEEVDELWLVTTLDIPALHQAKQIARLLKESGYKEERLRLLLNRAPRQTDLTTVEIEQLLGGKVTAMLPNDHEALYDSYADGKLVSPETRLGRHMSLLVHKIAGTRPQEKKKGILSFLA